MSADNPWEDLRKALVAHQKLLMSQRPGQRRPPDILPSIQAIARAADVVTEQTKHGVKGPPDHSFLLLNAMQIVGLAMASRWMALYALRGVSGPFSRMLDDLPEAPR